MRKIGLLFLFISSILLKAYSFQQTSPSQDLAARTSNLPQEKVYLHTDKPFYAAGETIWFKAYLRNATDHSANTPSKLVYTDFINPAGEVLLRRVLKTQNGSAPADILLPDSLEMGQYKLRAYTHYMRNFSPDFFFEKDIPIYTKNYSSSGGLVELDPQELDMQFFPEGGQFVAGLPNTVAFKVMRPNGQSANVSGYIIDNKKDTVIDFSTFKYGHGSVTFIPKEGKKYSARFNYKQNSYEEELPKPTKEGYTLQILSNTNDKITGMIRTNTEMGISGGLLTGQVRGKPLFEMETSSEKEFQVFAFSTKELPEGILQLTYFSRDNTPQCERLIFIEEKERATVKLDLNKGGYKTREEVKLTVDLPQKWKGADCSISVVDGSKVVGNSFSGDIRTSLLLTSDLSGTIENPGYYFYSQDSTRSEALDLVMMTHGWRRFTWQQVMEPKYEPLIYVPEETHIVEGLLRKYGDINTAVSGKVTLTGTNPILEASIVTDDTGRFRFFGVDYKDSAEFILQSYKINEKKGKEKKDFAIYQSVRKPYPSTHWFPYNTIKEDKEKTNDAEFGIFKIREGLFREDSSLIILEEITIEDKRQLNRFTKKTNYAGSAPINRIPIDSVSQYFNSVSNLLEQLTYVRRVNTGTSPFFMVHEMGAHVIVDKEFIFNHRDLDYMDPKIVDFIDVFEPNPYFGGDQFRKTKLLPGEILSLIPLNLKDNGYLPAIVIYTRGIPLENKIKTKGTEIFTTPGFYKVREFYAPKYTNNKEGDFDARTTLHWAPYIEFNSSGKAELSYYNSDGKGMMDVYLEGVTEDGKPVRERVSYLVK